MRSKIKAMDTNGICLEKCNDFPNCKPCGEMENKKEMKWHLYKKDKPMDDGEYWCMVHWHDEPVKLILRIESDYNENTSDSVYWLHWFESEIDLSKESHLEEDEEPTWWCEANEYSDEKPYAYVIESCSDNSILYIAKNLEYAYRLLNTQAFIFESFCIPVFKKSKQ